MPIFTKERLELFGKESPSFSQRIDWVIKNNKGVLYSDDFFKEFYTLYLQKIYGLHINFTLLQEFQGSEIKKYQISYQNQIP